MSDYDLKIEGDINLDAIPHIVRSVTRDLLEVSLSIVRGQVVVRTPKGVTGNLQASVSYDIAEDADGFVGILGTPLANLYGNAVEFGRKPGKKPPVEPLELWVVRKLGVEGAAAIREAAENVAWGIMKHGTPGHFMFLDGFNAAKNDVLKVMDTLPEEAKRRWESQA